jgi:hypothetical protein
MLPILIDITKLLSSSISKTETKNSLSPLNTSILTTTQFSSVKMLITILSQVS